MDIRVLSWDSDFFNLRIGRVDLFTPVDAAELTMRHSELKQQ